jgi:hypothetical protein
MVIGVSFFAMIVYRMHVTHKQRAAEKFSTARKIKKPWVFWSAHGLVCLFGFSGHSARAGQTLAKKIIKAKKSAGEKAAHRFQSFQRLKSEKNTRSLFPCQAFS